MKLQKVISELQERMADPFEKEACRILIDRLERKTEFGKILYSLLIKSENGDFK